MGAYICFSRCNINGESKKTFCLKRVKTGFKNIKLETPDKSIRIMEADR